MRKLWIDLHTHSSASDGSDSPTELVKKASHLALDLIALTDHDTIAGIEEAENAAKETGLRILHGCEFAVSYTDGEMHLLAYHNAESRYAVEDCIALARKSRHERNLALLERLSLLGYPLESEDFLDATAIIARPHIAAAMVKKGYVGSRGEAFSSFLAKGGRCYVPRKLPDPREWIEKLSKAGVSVVLAHPFLLENINEEKLSRLLQELQECGLSGLEAYHSRHDKKERKLCHKYAEKYQLAVTGGSDYHGSIKSNAFLGIGAQGKRLSFTLYKGLEQLRAEKGFGPLLLWDESR